MAGNGLGWTLKKMNGNNFGSQSFDDDNALGKDLGEIKRRNMDEVEWTYGEGSAGGVDLGSRGVSEEVGNQYSTPEYEVPLEKGTITWKGWTILAVVVTVLVGGIGFFLYNTLQAPARERDSFTALIEDYYDLAGEGALDEAAALYCESNKDSAYDAYLVTESVGRDLAFEHTGTVGIEALPIPKKGGFVKKKTEPTVYDGIVLPNFERWGIVTGLTYNENGQQEYVSYHISKGPQGQCISVHGVAVNDYGTLTGAGLSNPEEVKSLLDTTNKSSERF